MAMDHQHIIQKQTVRLTIDRKDNSLALQHRFEQMLEHRLLPELEKEFDRIAGRDTWVEMDQLEVHLGYLNPQATEKEWLVQTKQAYVTALKEKMQEGKEVRQSNLSETVLYILSYFLERGYFPWWAEDFPLEHRVQEQLPFLSTKVLDLLDTPFKRQRWTRQFGKKTQQKLWDAVAGKPWNGKNIPTALSLSLAEWESFWGLDALHNMYWESVWESLFILGDFESNWLPFLLEQSFKKSKLDDLRELATKVRQQASFSDRIRRVLLETISSWQENSEFSNRENTVPDFFKKEKTVDQGWSDLSSSQNSEEIYTPLAGVVLIHPFLPTFFDRLNLLEEGHFINQIEQERAVHLLYFLATGLVHPQEEEVVFLKLLCGINLEQPIAKEVDLTEEEQAEAIKLLGAVIGNWDALEGSLPEDLRGSFLVRAGRLKKNHMGWQLKVEEKPYDILMNKLSWGLSPVQHSWMREMIWVEWG